MGIRSISKPRALRLKEYARLRKAFLQERPYCEACRHIYPKKRKHYATEPHHIRGRQGSLLCATLWWVPVCRKAHNWIGDHPAKAREHGLLCQPGEWGKTPKTQHRRRE